ncbi:MAG: 5'-methylthioadenosine/adenosylhomocysteine nucleosidase [Clostridia bacterium]|nr:5'-methylthioadenosine/adenosylhomocysteine nucleosidase [Clostridia bacterium]
MIGIICAMKEELEEILIFTKDKTEETYGNFKFVKGNIFGTKCVLCLCGVGKVNAAICTQSLIIKYNPDFIINVGVAGGIAPSVKIGDIAVASGVIQHDYDISSFQNRKKGEIPGIDLVEIKTTKWITDKIIVCSSSISPVNTHTGIILSGDQFICSPQKLTELRNEFGGIACEMEAGSIGQVCYINKKEFGIIRSISDHADNSSNIDFDKFIKTSSRNAATILSNFIKSYQD